MKWLSLFLKRILLKDNELEGWFFLSCALFIIIFSELIVISSHKIMAMHWFERYCFVLLVNNNSLLFKNNKISLLLLIYWLFLAWVTSTVVPYTASVIFIKNSREDGFLHGILHLPHLVTSGHFKVLFLLSLKRSGFYYHAQL